MVEEKGEFPNPYVRSGPDKRRIKDTDIAHEYYNLLEFQRKQEKVPISKKVEYYNREGDNNSAIRQAAKSVQLERKTYALAEKLAVQEAKLTETTRQRDTDGVTGLIRKERYNELIERAVSEFRSFDTERKKGRQNLAIAKLDIDLFSWWNDLGGTTFGDFALNVVGNIIRRSIRAEDLAINKGGEELIIIPGESNSLNEYELEIGRIVRRIRTFAMEDILHILQDGQRKTTIYRNGAKLEERSSTIILKSFASELIKKTDIGGIDYFMDHGKGGIKKKRVEKVLESVKKKEILYTGKSKRLLSVLKEYISDDNTYSELETNDLYALAERKNIEAELCDIIQQIFDELTVSAGMIIYTEDDRSNSPVKEEIDATIDALNLKAKAYSPSSLATQVGRNAKLIHVNEVPAQMKLKRRVTDI